jgi:hypothetical protein
VLGSLVTIVRRTIPDLVTNTLTLLVPAVNLTAHAPEVTFTTLFFTTRTRTSVGGPAPVEGLIQRSTPYPVSCHATAGDFEPSAEITVKDNQSLQQGATDASSNGVDGMLAAFDHFGAAVSDGTFVPGDGAPGEDDAQLQASARRRIDDDDPLPDPGDDPPPPPPTPPVQGTLVRISSSELYLALLSVLQGTNLVVDTTGTSPTIPGDPVYHCTYPNQEIRQQLMDECLNGPPNDKARCLAQVNAEYPHIEECSFQRPPRHSYIDFGGIAESYGAVDVPFDSIDTIYRDTWGPGGINVDINYVRTTITASSLSAYFSPELSDRATASVWLTLQSNTPTLPCAHTASWLGCPDIELTDMRVLTRLTGIGPVADDPTQLGFSQAIATFYFNRNLNNIPDWMLTALVDVDQIISNNVQSNIQRALSSTAGRAALNKALTGLVAYKVNPLPTVGGGIKRFYRAWYEDGGTLVVDYEPQPRVGHAGTAWR